VTPCNLIDLYRRFGRKWCLYLQDRKANSVDRLVGVYVLGEGTKSEAQKELVGVGRALKDDVGLKQQRERVIFFYSYRLLQRPGTFPMPVSLPLPLSCSYNLKKFVPHSSVRLVVIHRTIWGHISEDSNVRSPPPPCENLKSRIISELITNSNLGDLSATSRKENFMAFSLCRFVVSFNT
jgi:hypothetical protein